MPLLISGRGSSVSTAPSARGGRERGPLVRVGDINDEVAYAAAMHGQCSPESIRSWTTLWASSSVRAIAPHPVITTPS